MKAHGAFFILLGVALLAAAQTGAAQSTPSYRPPPSSPQYRPPAQPPASAPAPSTAPSATAPATTPSPAASTAPAPITPVTSKTIQAVSIQNSPGVPDTGGHCILCGLVTGNFTAVEPNLVICVTPTGTTGGRRACTDICPPGHDCKKELGEGVRLNGASPSVHVEVLDNDKDGKIQQLAAFDEMDATQCTTAQPCKVDDADDQAAGTLVSFEFGSPEGCVTSAAARETGQVLLASTMIVPGLLPAQTPTKPQCEVTFTSYSGAITSQQLFLAFMSLYEKSKLFKDRVDVARGQVKQINVVVVGNGGRQYDTLMNAANRGSTNLNANNEAASQSDQASGASAGYQKPLPDLFAFTLPPDPNGEIDVVISAKALAYGYYPAVDTSNKTAVMNPTADKPEPIQLVLAYELGSNVVGLAANKNYPENPDQPFTNCMMEQAFPAFVANGNAVLEKTGTDAKNQQTYTYLAITGSAEPVTIVGTTAIIRKPEVVIRAVPHGVYDAGTGNPFPGSLVPSSLTSPDPPAQETVTYWLSARNRGDPVGPLSFCKKPTGTQPPDPTSCPNQQAVKGIQPEAGPPTC